MELVLTAAAEVPHAVRVPPRASDMTAIFACRSINIFPPRSGGSTKFVSAGQAPIVGHHVSSVNQAVYFHSWFRNLRKALPNRSV